MLKYKGSQKFIMNDYEEEEIDAENDNQGEWHWYLPEIPSISFILENYGWPIVFCIVFLVFVYKKFIAPKWQAMQAEKLLIEQKKFDADAQTAHAEKLRAARERAQMKVEEDSVKEKERQEAKRAEALENAIKKSGMSDFFQPSTSGSRRSAKVPNVKTYIMNMINSTPVVVFSKTNCPFCRKTKQALSSYRLSPEFYKIIELDELENMDAIQNELQKITGARTVPRVFVGGKCIGGCDDTLTAHRDGGLQKMFVEAGIL